MFRLRGWVEVHPTENPEKVKAAVSRLFGNLEFKTEKLGEKLLLSFHSETRDCLSKFKRIVRQDMIRDAVRSHLKACITDGLLRFYLHKQVAFAGHVSLCEPEGESPLGPITVEIEDENLHELVNWLTEKNV